MNTLEDIRDELKALPNDLEGAYQNMFTYMSRDFLSQTPGAHLVPYYKGLLELQESSSTCDLSLCKLALSGQKNGQGVQVVAYREEEFTIHALLGAIGFAVDQESPLSDVLKRRKIPSTTQSKDGLEFMQQRLLECTSHHGH
ncbi:Uncharacterized protein HZ326_16913 [Fusarium oxysporum f. sp. albedinis]|nr:Uncharacterized protein HZ326_16913 [Fusarium oxysporum f. sp. albedinis]